MGAYITNIHTLCWSSTWPATTSIAHIDAPQRSPRGDIEVHIRISSWWEHHFRQRALHCLFNILLVLVPVQNRREMEITNTTGLEPCSMGTLCHKEGSHAFIFTSITVVAYGQVFVTYRASSRHASPGSALGLNSSFAASFSKNLAKCVPFVPYSTPSLLSDSGQGAYTLLNHMAGQSWNHWNMLLYLSYDTVPTLK